MSSERVTLHRIDAHEIRIAGPDEFHVTFVGDTSLAQSRAITGWVEGRLAQLAGAYLLCDLRQAGSLDAETRRFVADWISRHRLSAIANYGGGLLTRTFSNLAVSAIRALGRSPVDNRFFATESDARAWIAEVRRRRALDRHR